MYWSRRTRKQNRICKIWKRWEHPFYMGSMQLEWNFILIWQCGNSIGLFSTFLMQDSMGRKTTHIWLSKLYCNLYWFCLLKRYSSLFEINIIFDMADSCVGSYVVVVVAQVIPQIRWFLGLVVNGNGDKSHFHKPRK